jgi:hypothetical protein
MKLINARTLFALGLAAAALGTTAMAQKKYDPGADDKEIRIGQTIAFSGPASSYGTIGKAEAACFRMIDDRGGVDRREIKFIQNVMKQATSVKNFVTDLGLPGMSITTSPGDYRVNKPLRMQRFNGERWELFGPVLEGGAASR